MHAQKFEGITEATPELLEQYDAFLFGIPTRYGNYPAQFKTFWDRTGGQWQKAAYWGKYAGLFVSTGTAGGGQESTCIAAMSTLAHHGIIYVPLGYATAFPILADLSEVRGGSPWGAGTFAVSRDTLRIHVNLRGIRYAEQTIFKNRPGMDPVNQARKKNN